MAKKTAMPALYEKMRTRPSAPVMPSVPRHPEVSPRPPTIDALTHGNWLSPGRVVRLPVGYLLLGAAAAFTIVLVTYIIAFQRGRTTEKAEIQWLVNDGTASGEIRVSDDPLAQSSGAPSVSGAGFSPAGGSAGVRPQGRPASAWAAINADPRKKGVNYFVVAETQESGAIRVAEFCRAKGLETYVVAAKNDRRRVIVLPGFEPTARSSPEVKALESQIRDVGEKWKKSDRKNSNFDEAYPLLFTG